MTEPEQLEKAIAHLETQRALLGDAAVDAAVAVLRTQIAASTPSPHPEPRRRQVTIPFADVSGFTAMSEAIGRLIAASAGLPFLLIALARSTFFRRQQHWVADASVTYVPLAPPSRAGSLSLVREILQKAGLRSRAPRGYQIGG